MKINKSYTIRYTCPIVELRKKRCKLVKLFKWRKRRMAIVEYNGVEYEIFVTDIDPGDVRGDRKSDVKRRLNAN